MGILLMGACSRLFACIYIFIIHIIINNKNKRTMRKESLFTADKMTAKRVYQSPAMRVVKLGTTSILAGSGTQVEDPYNGTTEEEW